MSLDLAIYIVYVFVNSLIVILNIVVIWAAVKSRELRHNSAIHIVLTAIILDIAVYFIVIVHDLPSFILDKDFSTTGATNFYVLILCLQWFAQLLYLPLLSILHLFAIFSPLQFRSASHKLPLGANIAVIVLALLITAPLFTTYCGYAYLVSGHYWYFDFEKPYTYFYKELNQILQIGCGAFVLISDIIIIYKVIRLRSHELHGQSGSGFIKDWKFGPESRIAINFLVMSSCYLFMSAFYNIDMGYGFWQILVLKLSTLLNLSKWALYLLANTSVYKIICRKLGVQSHHHIFPPSVTNGTHF